MSSGAVHGRAVENPGACGKRPGKLWICYAEELRPLLAGAFALEPPDPPELEPPELLDPLDPPELLEPPEPVELPELLDPPELEPVDPELFAAESPPDEPPEPESPLPDESDLAGLPPPATDSLPAARESVR